MAFRVLAVLLTLAMLGTSAAAPAADLGSHRPCGGKVLPPARGAYLGAFPNFDLGQRNEDGVSAARPRSYEQLAGRPVAWAYFSDH